MKTTHLLVAINVLVYAAMAGVAGASSMGEFSSETLLGFGALWAPAVRDGEWWRLLAMPFMHVSALHLVMNMVALLQVGALLEPHYGRRRFLLLYLLAGVGGAAASLAWNWVHPVVSAGASGAISGLVGAGLVSGQLLARRSAAGVGGREALEVRNVMLRWALILVAMVFLVARVDHAAHLGGLVVGGLVAWAFDGGGRALGRRAAPGIGVESYLLVVGVGLLFAVAGRAQQRDEQVRELIVDGAALAKRGELEGAASAFEKAAALLPREPVSHYDLAVVRLRQGRLADAEAAARRAIAADGDYGPGWGVLADVLEQQAGRTDEAKAARSHASGASLRDEPDDAHPHTAPATDAGARD